MNQNFTKILNGFKEGNNYNPMKHFEWHNQNKNTDEYKTIELKI